MNRYDRLYSEYSDSYSSPDAVRERIAASERERQTNALERIASALERLSGIASPKIEYRDYADASDAPDYKD